MMTELEKRIAKLEELVVPSGRMSLHGTSISRIMMDHKLFAEYGLSTEKITGHQSSMVWCLALGLSYEPKALFYGHTITEAVEKAERAFTERQ